MRKGLAVKIVWFLIYAREAAGRLLSPNGQRLFSLPAPTLA